MDWHRSVRIPYKILNNEAHNVVSETVNTWRNVSRKSEMNFTEVNRSKECELCLFRDNKNPDR